MNKALCYIRVGTFAREIQPSAFFKQFHRIASILQANDCNDDTIILDSGKGALNFSERDKMLKSTGLSDVDAIIIASASILSLNPSEFEAIKTHLNGAGVRLIVADESDD